MPLFQRRIPPRQRRKLAGMIRDDIRSAPRYASSVVTVRSSFPLLPSEEGASSQQQRMDYVRGWAWQTVLLQQRLLQQDETTDTILFLEHDPVYTLGRGADESFIRQLFGDAAHPHHQEDDTRERLSRQNRHRSTASRLMMESSEYRSLLQTVMHRSNFNDHHHAMVDLLCHHCTPPNPVRLPVLFPNAAVTENVPVYRVERGGQVTFHGPGQLMVYPLFDLARFPKPDLHWFVRQLEQVIILTLQEILPSSCRIHRDPAYTGVWIDAPPPFRRGKIAAIGIHAARWRTSHGICLNINNNNLDEYFDPIVPCGLADRAVTSIEALLQQSDAETTEKKQWSLSEVAQLVLKHMQAVFSMDRLVYGDSLR